MKEYGREEAIRRAAAWISDDSGKYSPEEKAAIIFDIYKQMEDRDERIEKRGQPGDAENIIAAG